MARFFAIRLGRAALTIVLVVTFAFVVLRLSGDPALMIMGPEAPPEVIAAFRKAWGLDAPIWMQYFDYFGAIAKGELGRSMRDGRPAIELVLERIPATLILTLPAMALKVGIGIPAGIYAALSGIADRPRRDDGRGCRLRSRASCWRCCWCWCFGNSDGCFRRPESWRRHPASDYARYRWRGGAGALYPQRVRKCWGGPTSTASAKGRHGAVVIGHALPNAAIPTVTIMAGRHLDRGAVVVEACFVARRPPHVVAVATRSRDRPRILPLVAVAW